MIGSRVASVRCAKQAYASRDEARQAMAALQRDPRRALQAIQTTGRLPVRVYHCDRYCGWHLTSRPTWQEEGQAG